MAQTKVVIIYSPNQNRRRTVVKPDDDSQIDLHLNNIIKGEAAFVGTLADYETIGPDAMLEAYTGKTPSSDRCIVVHNNTVIAVVCADPLIDTWNSDVTQSNTNVLSASSIAPAIIADPTGNSQIGDIINVGISA